MEELTTVKKQLPDTLPELSKFVLVGREKLTAVRAEIRAIKKVGLAKEVREQKLHEAQDIADAVLDAEVKIGELMKDTPKSAGGRPSKTTPNAGQSLSTKADTIKDMGFTHSQVQRFETLAAHPDIVEQAKAEARQNDDIISRSSVLNAIKLKENKPHVANNSHDDEWYTPAHYIEAAREVMGTIDLDPASNDFANNTIKAKTYYTEETNGLDQKWFGNIWMNPPYSTALLSKFADKLTSGGYKQAIVLVNNATETEWFSKMISCASAIVFHHGRIRFEKRDGAHGVPLQGQAFIYCGDKPNRFLEVFQKYGWGAKL